MLRRKMPKKTGKESSITKMGKNENVNTDALVRICRALSCDIGDIAEIVLQESKVE